MAQANFVIVEGAESAPLVENDGVIWYHVGRSHFLSKIGENKEGSTPRPGCAALSSFHWKSFRSCVHAKARRWRAYEFHSCLLYMQDDSILRKREWLKD
jgi:hypothetical protein